MTFGGLVLIALGTGGIKPCVAAFGGDQFKDHQVTYMNHVKLCIIFILLWLPTFRNICSPNSFPSSISLLMPAV